MLTSFAIHSFLTSTRQNFQIITFAAKRGFNDKCINFGKIKLCLINHVLFNKIHESDGAFLVQVFSNQTAVVGSWKENIFFACSWIKEMNSDQVFYYITIINLYSFRPSHQVAITQRLYDVVNFLDLPYDCWIIQKNVLFYSKLWMSRRSKRFYGAPAPCNCVSTEFLFLHGNWLRSRRVSAKRSWLAKSFYLPSMVWSADCVHKTFFTYWSVTINVYNGIGNKQVFWNLHLVKKW